MGILMAFAPLLLAGPLQSAPPPPMPELERQLEDKPLNLASWPDWSPRLRDWSDEHFQAAFPAFRDAFRFVRGQLTSSSVRPLPRPLDRDAIAFMVLAGAMLHDARSKEGPVARGRAAADYARRSLRLDGNLARAHFYLAWAIQMEQLAPPEQGGAAQPDRNRLNEALKALRHARALKPNVAWLPHEQAATLAERAQKWDDAETYLILATAARPNDVELARRLAQAVIAQRFPYYQRDQPFAAPIAPLIEKFPADGVLAGLHAHALLQDKQPVRAGRELARARRLGTDPATVMPHALVEQAERDYQRHMEEQTASGKPAEGPPEDDPVRSFGQFLDKPLYLLKIVGWFFLGFTVVYVIVMSAMTLAGILLARHTRGPIESEMMAAHDQRASARGQAYRTQLETSLTFWYALALLSGLLLFYFALPLVFLGLLVVVVLTMTVLGAGRSGARDDLAGHLLRAGGGGLSAVLMALFASAGEWGRGVRKTRAQCPRLFMAIDEVAAKVETETPDEVWIAPGAEFSVCQRGRGPFGAFGGKRRVLTIGLCVLNFLTESEFKSILAHEFAHFSHADTYWHRFIYQVTLSLRTAIREMARTGGWVTWINPFYWFFWLYSRSYSLLAAGFSRSREFLADRMACNHYGADVFGIALEKVCVDGAQFERVIYKNVASLLGKNQAFINLYLAFRKYREAQAGERQRRLAELMEETPSLFDSHPTYSQRLAAARLLPPAQQRHDAPASALFENPEEIERELTEFLTAMVAAR